MSITNGKRRKENHMACKGICIRYKATKPTGVGRYSTGQKRCQICTIFLKWDGLWCPCCGSRLRTGPRNVRFKAELRAFKKINDTELTALNEQPSKAFQKHM